MFSFPRFIIYIQAAIAAEYIRKEDYSVSDINPETAAHNIASIFCGQRFKTISAQAIQKRADGIAAKTRGIGNPDVDIVKEMSSEYAYAYNTAFNEIQNHNQSFREFE